MAGAAQPPKPRKRVDADTNASLKRARDGSAYTKCDECGRHVAVALIDMHDCSLDSRIKMHLDSHVVEKPTEPKKPVQKKKPATEAAEKSEKKGSGGKNKKAGKDPNMPKRPPSAFFVFMAEFREKFKEANPDNKKVSLVAKEGGDKWKSLTEEEKKPYVEKAAELKVEYEKKMEEYKSNAADDEVEEVEAPGSAKGEEEDEVKEAGVEDELEDDLKETVRPGRRVVMSDDEE